MTKKAIKKEVRKEIKKDLKAGRRRPNRSGDDVAKYLELSQTNARQAALATLDPETAVDKGFLPGVCDGTFNNTVRWSSRTKLTIATRAMNTEFGAQLMVSPCLNDQITEVTAWNPSYQPSANNSYDDSSYAAALTSVESVRCVALVLEIRCLDKTLDLNGSRTLVQGDLELYNGDNNNVYSRKDAVTIGNNKPGEVSRMPWLNPEITTFFGVTTIPSALGEVPRLHAVIFTDSANVPFQISTVAIWEAIPLVNSLATVLPYIGDPTTYAASLQAALSKVPLNAHERVSYADDGIVSSIASDVKTIIGGVQTAKRMYEDYKGTFNQAVNFLDSVGSTIGGFFDGLFSEEKRDPTPEEQQIIAAYLSLSMQRTGAALVLNFLSEKFKTMTPEQVSEWVKSELGTRSKPRGGTAIGHEDPIIVAAPKRGLLRR